MSYSVSPLNDVLSKYPEEHVSAVLSSFSCERDKEVELFLREKAIVQEKKQTSRTYLIFDDDAEHLLVAFFAVAVSIIKDEGLKCSSRMLRKMNINEGIAMSYLIGQLGKRDGGAKGLGTFAIERAIGIIVDANAKVGCRVIRIDCRESLIGYYESNGFTLVRSNKEGNLNLLVRIIETGSVPA